jgi:hypothetical protein
MMTSRHIPESNPSHRVVYALLWALLALIPILTLGPAVGRYGPVTDDWSHLRLVIDGAFVNVDLTRPLHHVTTAAAYALAGGSVTGMFALLVALQAVEAILCFEVLRRVLAAAELVPRLAAFAAFSGAAVFALYPADVSRLTLMMTHGRVMLITVLALVLVWLHAVRHQRAWLIYPAALAAVAILLVKESAFFLLALIPVALVLSPKPLRAVRRPRWIAVLVVWFGTLGVYGVWRFVLIPPVVAEVTARPMREIGIGGAVELATGTARALTRFMGSIFTATYGEHTSGLALGRPLDALPLVALIAAAMLMLAAYAVTLRLPASGQRISISMRFALMFGVYALALWLGGAAPYLLRDPDSLIIYNIASRDTQVANLGAAALWLAMGLLAAALLDRAGRPALRAVPLAVIGVLLLTTSVVRQTHTAQDAIDAWQIQRGLWLEFEALPLDLGPGDSGLLLLRDFPYDTRNAMYISDSWAYRDGFYLLFGRSLTALPVHEVDVTALDADSIALTFKRRPRTFTGTLDALRVAAYDAASGRITLEAALPEALGHGPLALSTGDPAAASVSQRTAFGQQVLGAP